MDDLIAQNMYAREAEFFTYSLDVSNFEHMLKKLPAGKYRADIEKRLLETRGQMAGVDLVYAALASQITDQRAHATAITRVKKRMKCLPTSR